MNRIQWKVSLCDFQGEIRNSELPALPASLNSGIPEPWYKEALCSICRCLDPKLWLRLQSAGTIGPQRHERLQSFHPKSWPNCDQINHSIWGIWRDTCPAGFGQCLRFWEIRINESQGFTLFGVICPSYIQEEVWHEHYSSLCFQKL